MGSREALRLVTGEGEKREGSVPRFRVLLSAALVTTTAEKSVKIRNISFSDAIVEASGLPPAGTDVILKRGRFEAFGNIEWVNDGRAGIAFDEPLSETELWTQVNRPEAAAASAAPPGLRRPGFREARLTAEEREAASAWGRPAGREAFRD